MDEKNSFVFYDEWFEYLEDFDADEIASFFENLKKLRSGEEINESNKTVRMLLKVVKKQIQRDSEKYTQIKEKRTENLKKANKTKSSIANAVQMQNDSCECNANAVQMHAVNVDVDDNVDVDVDVNTPPNPLKGDKSVKAGGFTKFWELYPRKVEKKKAKDIWNKIPSSSYQLIFSHIEIMSKSEEWKRDGGRYIPHPTTYLRGERWKDEVLNSCSLPDYVAEKL